MNGRESYDVALICKNGHIINSRAKTQPQRNTKYCSKCGAETIDRCVKCSTEIRGYHYIPRGISLSPTKPPQYCHNCGHPYPWTQARLRALDEMIELMEELSKTEKEDFKQSLRDIMTDNPRTKLGTMKIEKYAAKIGEEIWGKIREIIIDIASETALKAMGLK